MTEHKEVSFRYQSPAGAFVFAHESTLIFGSVIHRLLQECLMRELTTISEELGAGKAGADSWLRLGREGLQNVKVPRERRRPHGCHCGGQEPESTAPVRCGRLAALGRERQLLGGRLHRRRHHQAELRFVDFAGCRAASFYSVIRVYRF